MERSPGRSRFSGRTCALFERPTVEQRVLEVLHLMERTQTGAVLKVLWPKERTQAGAEEQRGRGRKEKPLWTEHNAPLPHCPVLLGGGGAEQLGMKVKT